MTYFQKFPLLSITQNEKFLLVRDIFSRITIADKFQENTVLLENYIVLDGETPELVSQKFYETPFNHWIILMVNNIVDPREEWPIPENRVVDRVYANYDMVITVPSGAAYSVDDSLESNTGGKFKVSSKSGNTIYIRSQNGFQPLTTSNTLENLTTEVSGLTISSVTLPTNRIHHYYDTELEYIVDYDAGNPNITSVTNLEYEIDVNDTKRTIKMLPAVYVTAVEREFNRLAGL
jgi:hypothetical protein